MQENTFSESVKAASGGSGSHKGILRLCDVKLCDVRSSNNYTYVYVLVSPCIRTCKAVFAALAATTAALALWSIWFTFDELKETSAFGGKADLKLFASNVRFVPTTDYWQ